MNDEAVGAEGILPAPVSQSELRKVIEVSAGLIFRNGLLLITQRRPGDHLEGLWEFPGGSVCLKNHLRHVCAGN